MSIPKPASRLQQHYDREAGQYDAVRPTLVEGSIFNELQLDILRAWLPLGRGTTLLSLPVGTGRLNEGLENTGGRIVGCDISRNMLDLAAQKIRARGLHGVVLLQGNGLKLPFADESFDAIVCCNLFHLIPNEQKPQFIAEFGRVLKPGGRLVADFKSPFYGGVLALWRCSFRKRNRFSITTKCVFPGQFPALFGALRVMRRRGVKLPFSEQLEQVFGRAVMKRVNLGFGRIPVLRYFAYGVLVEAQKEPGRGSVDIPALA